MKDIDTKNLSWDEWDELRRPAPETTDFDRIVEAALSRRGFLGGVLAFGSGAAAMGTGTLMSSTSAQAQASRFAFTPIPIATDATVHVPEGYSWSPLAMGRAAVLRAWPILITPPEDLSPTATRSSARTPTGWSCSSSAVPQVIAVNHEYVNPDINLPQHADGATLSADDVLKLQNLQGVSVIEVAEGADGWAVVVDSPFNRRITPQHADDALPVPPPGIRC